MSSLYCGGGGGYVQTVELPDGGMCAINWWRAEDSSGRIALVFPGMANSSETGFVRRLCRDLAEAGWDAGVVDYRGCGMCSVREDGHVRLSVHTLKSWEDLQAVVEACGPSREIVAIGQSLGGAILLSHLGRTKSTRISAAVAISAPIDSEALLDNSAYDAPSRFLLTSAMKFLVFVNSKARKHLNLWRVLSSTDIDSVTRNTVCGVLDEYETSREYAQANSPLHALANIQIPTLLIHAANDPIVPVDRTSFDAALENPRVGVVLTRCGGHLAFLDVLGRPFADNLAIDFLEAHRRNPSKLVVRLLGEDEDDDGGSPRVKRSPSFRGKLLGF